MHDWDELELIVYCRACDAERAHGTRIDADGRFEFTCSEYEETFRT